MDVVVLSFGGGFRLDMGHRTAMEDVIAIVLEFLSSTGWRDDGSVGEEPLVHYFGLFDSHGGPQLLFGIKTSRPSFW